MVEFFLEEIFLGIFHSNFPGPVVDFFLGKIFLRNFSPTDAVWTGCGGVVVWTGWTSGRVFS